MPFQGNPNAGAVDPGLLQLLFQQKENRARLQMEQQKAQMEMERAAKEDARKDEAHRLDLLSKRAELASKLQTVMGPQVDAARRTSEQTSATNLTREDLLADGGGADFASIVAQNDPTAGAQVQATDEAQANFLTQASFASELAQQLNPGASPDQALSSALGAGRAVESERDRKARIALEKKTAEEGRAEEAKRAEENRAEQRQIRSEIRVSENAIANAGRMEEAREIARLGAGDALITIRADLRKQIAMAEKDGRDTTLLNERLGLLNGRIRKIQDPNTVQNVRPMPAVERIKTVRQYRGAVSGLNRTVELGQALDDGSVKIGAAGKVENFKLRAVGMLENLAQIDPNFDAEVRSAIQDAIGNGDTTVTLTTDAGNQLTLGLDQIQLTYDFIRNGRGGGDRITVGEIERVSRELNFTGLLTTPDQIRGALKKVAKELAREKATAAAIYEAFEQNPGDLQGEEIFPDDAALIEVTFGETAPRGTVDLGVPSGASPEVSPTDPALEAARRRRQGGASGSP